MASEFFYDFETTFGWGALVGRDAVLVGVAFPQHDRAAMQAGIARSFGAAERATPPEWMAVLAAQVQKLFANGRADFAGAPIDMSAIDPFDRDVLALTRKIQPGETRTYGDIAKKLGDVSLSRRVGQSLGRNPFPVIIPCHRVVGADGAMTGFSAPGGAESKRALLKIEGALAPELFD